VTKLMQLLELVHPDDSIQYATLMALAEAAHSPEARDLAVPRLEAALDRELAYPDMTRNLRAAIQQALAAAR